MKWLWQLLVDPVSALDLKDKRSGGVDHGKVIGFFSFLTIWATLLLYVTGHGKLLPLGHTIALISTAYGWAGWRAFLASRIARTRTEHVEVDQKYPYGPPTYIYDA